MTKLIYAISKKSDGNMSFRYGPAGHVLQNRSNFLSSHGIVPDNCVAMNLQNGNECVIVTGKDKGRGMKSFDGIAADCLITKEKGIFLFTFVGDCLPLIIHDTDATVVGLGIIVAQPQTVIIAFQVEDVRVAVAVGIAWRAIIATAHLTVSTTKKLG